MGFMRINVISAAPEVSRVRHNKRTPSFWLRLVAAAVFGLICSAQMAFAQVATLNDQAPAGFGIDFNTSPTASGTIPNVGTGSGPGGWKTAQFDFGFSILGSSTWNGGVEFQEQDGVQQIWHQPTNTNYPTDGARYTIDFTRGVGGLTFYHGGLDNQDAVLMTAFYQGVPVPLSTSYFDSFTGSVAITNSTANSVEVVGPASGNADERAREYRVTFPDNVLVDQLIFVVGKFDGRTGTVTLAHYLFDWLPLTINAEDDIGPSVSTAVNAPNVLNVLADNGNGADTLDDPNTVAVDAATSALVTVTPTAALPAGITLDAAGNISVASGTAPASYAIAYEICELANPTNCATATAFIDVTPPQPPVASDDAIVSTVFAPVTIDPLANDNDTDGMLDPTSVVLTLAGAPADAILTNGGKTLTVPGEGVWTVDVVSGEITFTPDPDLVGSPTPVSYIVQDNDGNPSNLATITVTYDVPTLAMTVLKTVDASGVSSPAQVGETVRWTITVENDGNVALAGFTPVDTLTDGNGVPLTLTQDVTKVSESFADDEILLVGEIATYTVAYVLEQSAIDSGQLINVAVSEAQPVTPDGTPILTSSGFLSTSDDPADSSNVDSDGDGNPDDPTILNLTSFDGGALVLTKTSSADIVIAGAAVPYELTVTNTAPGIAAGLGVRDVLPADLSYVLGSATVDGVAVDVAVSGQTITFPDVDIPGGGSVVLGLVARVGPFASGDLVNTAQMFDPVTGVNIGEAATATVQVRPEAVFQCSDVIGKVFDDVNQNGYQDGPFTPNRAAITDQRYLGEKFARPAEPSEIVEPGLPGVRLATTDGTIITTDDYGRFSVPCAALPPRIGQNFTLKIDVNSLPTGYRMTTENPRTMRLTAGIMTEMNFGASIGRVVDIDLTAAAFGGANQPVDQLMQGLDGLLGQVASAPATLRITYFTNGEGTDVARARLDALEEIIQDKWRAIGTGRLRIERTVARLQ